jgi:hypothetical protein
MSWENIIKRLSEEEVRSDAQQNADELNKPLYLFQEYGHPKGAWQFYDEPPKGDIKYEIINPTVRIEEGTGFSDEFRVKEGMDTSK